MNWAERELNRTGPWTFRAVAALILYVPIMLIEIGGVGRGIKHSSSGCHHPRNQESERRTRDAQREEDAIEAPDSLREAVLQRAAEIVAANTNRNPGQEK